ncbi:MAG: serine/threonine-protein kinase [Acidobacteria bacterium]|nr:serine/threonine-protein kinase [Acidobacteriota bacterium]
MSIEIGNRLGPYEILEKIGEGGMGEVYRARDTRLNRNVAIKVLPGLFAADPDRLARFDREAQALAALNHPHIAQIHGLEESGGARALVMEFVDGEDLAQRLARGPIPVPEALAIARQIADALEAAHDHGIIHRDLKPANIKLREDGTVKVLDFGLAKLAAADGSAISEAEAMNSPTLTMRATQMGFIIGTAAYMAPEQARGKPVDRRADLWALGVVLYEMLSGLRAFASDEVSDTLAAVLTREPDLTTLPPGTPPGIRRLLRRCLEKDRRRRLADAGEARAQIDEALSDGPDAPAATRPAARRASALLPWAAAALLAAVAAAGWWQAARRPEPPALRYTIQVPPGATVALVARPLLALSPDGASLAYLASGGGVSRLVLQRHDEFEPRPVPGTEGASHPVFSPDGQWIAFYADNRLNKTPAAGGPIVPVAIVNDPRGLSWDTDSTITYTPEATGGVFQVDANGGAPRPITSLAGDAERTHRWPQLLPGGRAVIYTVGTYSSPDNYDASPIEATILASGERRTILTGASMARYVPSGHLVFARGSILYAVRFDPERLETRGTPVILAQDIAGDSTTGAAHFTFSQSGTFAYVPGTSERAASRLVWVNRAGEQDPLQLPGGIYYDPKLSPDGRRIAMVSVTGGHSDIWMYDVVRNTATRMTYGGVHSTPLWSRDGSMLYFVSVDPRAQGGSSGLWRRPSDASRDAELVVRSEQRIFLGGWIEDQARVLLDHFVPGGKADVAALRLVPDARMEPLVASQFDEYAATASPDGRYVAYQSDETSRFEVYARAVDGAGGRWRISTSGGEEPRWAPDGRQLYYRSDTALMAVPVDTRGAFEVGAPVRLFDGILNLRSESGISYDVHPEDDRFLMTRLAAENVSFTTIRIVHNWFRELEQATAR